VNLFSNAHIPRRDVSPSEEASDDPRPLLYLGTFKSQLYIQESERQRKTATRVPLDNQHLQPPFFHFPRITWRPYLISASSRTPIINHGAEPPGDLPLLTHDKRRAENTALAVVGDAGSDYPFDSGLYLFPDEPHLDYDLVEDLKNKSKSTGEEIVAVASAQLFIDPRPFIHRRPGPRRRSFSPRLLERGYLYIASDR